VQVECRAVEEMRRGLDYRLVQVSSMQSKVKLLAAVLQVCTSVQEGKLRASFM